MRRYELTDEQWTLVAPLLPSQDTGRPRRDDRAVLNAVFWKLCSGAAWRDVPERYGPWQTVYERFARYRDDGTLDRILATLRLRLAGEGNIDWTTWMVDATIVRASRVAAGARKRGATTKRAIKRSAEVEAG
jgi:transposase